MAHVPVPCNRRLRSHFCFTAWQPTGLPGGHAGVTAVPHLRAPPLLQSRARKLRFTPKNQPSNRFKFCTQKYPACFFLKIGNACDIQLRREGRIANVTYARRDAVDATAPTDERHLLRTVKSCGPGAPMQAPSPAEAQGFAKATVTTQGSPGRVRISRKTTAQGRPECLRLYLWFSRSRNLFLREGPGCSGHPAFPAPSRFRG
jgi:hypothetical protein